MKEPGQVLRGMPDGFIDSFIDIQVIGRGLDQRTGKAYRLDLEHFYKWMEKDGTPGEMDVWEKRIEQYISYLSQERRLCPSTISRKYRVFGYFLGYLVQQGALSGTYVPKPLKSAGTQKGPDSLSKDEVDAFFKAIRREREELDSDFRRRVCLRDQIMMELLFYHGLEVSELLKMEVSDYNPASGNLLVRKKKGKVCTVRVFSKDLRKQVEQWLTEHEYFEHDEEYRERMFLSKLGRPLSMKMVILIFEKYRILAGIEKEFTPKDLKNSLERYGRELVREQCEGNA